MVASRRGNLLFAALLSNVSKITEAERTSEIEVRGKGQDNETWPVLPVHHVLLNARLRCLPCLPIPTYHPWHIAGRNLSTTQQHLQRNKSELPEIPSLHTTNASDPRYSCLIICTIRMAGVPCRPSVLISLGLRFQVCSRIQVWSTTPLRDGQIHIK